MRCAAWAWQARWRRLTAAGASAVRPWAILRDPPAPAGLSRAFTTRVAVSLENEPSAWISKCARTTSGAIASRWRSAATSVSGVRMRVTQD